MKIAFNPSTVAALTTPPNNKDITFDLRGRNIFARGVKFCGTDTNTWRDIKINNVSIDSNILDLRNGSNTTLTNTNGVVTINSTWRPVVDNLTSDSTTSSLSANQGRVLKSLIDGKSNSDHNHDGRYLRLNGSDTMQGNLYLHSHGTSYIGRGSGDKSGADFTEANIVIRSWWGISFKSYDDIVRTYIDTRTGNIGTKGVLNAVGAVIQGRVYNGGDDEGIIIKPASNGYAGLILGAHNSERSVFYLTKGNPFWRYNNGSTNLDIQHPKKPGTIALISDIPNKNSWNYDDRYLKLTGGTMASNALITFADSGSWGTDKEPQGARGGLYWTGQSDYAKLYAEETAGNNLDLVIQFGDDNSNGLSIRNKANTQTSYISAGGVITTGTFKGNLDWSYITNKPSSYTPSAHTHAWNSLTHSSTTENQAILTNGKANGWKLYTLNISRWDNAANNAHSHANKSVLDGITSALVNNWNVAYTFVNTISGTDTDKVINKWDEIVNFLAGITEDNKLNTLLNSKLSIQQLSTKDILTTKTNNALFWVNTIGTASSITTGPFTDHPYALLSVTNYNQNTENSKFFYRSRLAFSSTGDIKVASCHHENVYKQDETWYNVLTSKNSGISGSTIKLNGTSITVYSSSTADGRYVKKTGDTMSGTLTIDTTNFGALTIKRNDDANGASIQFRGKSSVYGYIGLNNSTKDKQFLRWNSDTSKTYTILDTSSTYTSNGKGVINGTTITQVDNATNSTNSTNARKLVNWYSTRPTSLNAQFGDGSLRIFYATSSTTEGKPDEDSHILHLAWDNNGGWDAQLAVHTRSGKVSTRAQNSGTWQPWKTLAFTTDIPSSLKNPYSLTTFGVVYDGSSAKTVTTSNFISQVTEGTDTVTDGTMFITSWASNSGFADTNAVNVPYKRKAIHLWEYIKAKTDSLYTTKSHNHDDRYVRAFGTSNDNIDSDWGQSFKTFDPIPSGTPPEQNPNISILNIGNNFNRRKQLAFIYSNDNIYYRRHVDNSFTNWRRIAFANEIPTSLKNPYALTISLNGTSQGPYDGSAAKNINITPGSIGAATSNHTHPYLPLSGGTVTGNIILKGGTSADMTYAGNVHPYIRFDNSVSSQNVSLIFTDYDTYRIPAGIKLVGNQGNEWFEAANIYATTFYGALSGNASSANKLTTARNIALGTDLRGSANFDGSSNITISANINACTVQVSSTNGLPFKRIAHFETGSSWDDNALLLYISQGYVNGSNGICRVEFRTENISSSSTSVTAYAAVRWLVRNGYGLDSLYVGYYVTTSKAYIDIYLKTTSSYQGTVIRVLQDSRGDINSNVQLINSYYYSDTNHKEAYNSIEAASTALYNRAYTRIVSGSDVGTVSYSNSTGSVHWNNVTNKPSTFTPAAHTHTVFQNNLMIKGTNGISDSASIHLGIGDSDTGFKWISDGKCQVYANNVAVGEWTSGGMNWFKNPTVNGNKIWNAGNDGSGSELDADTVDGYHASKFPYINNNGIWRIYGNAAVAALADNTAGLSSWAFGESRDSRITYLGILKPSTATCGINAHGTIAVFGQGDTHLGIASDYVRANLQVFGGNADKIVWRKKVAFTDSNVASATKLATARTIWGQSFDGTRDIPINVAAKMPLVFFKRFDNNENAGYVGCGSTKNNNIYISSYINANIILDGNNIGIGTASPAYKLDVKGDIRATGNSYATHFYESSDKTLKKNIKSILSSANIPKIREFDWKDTEEHSYGFIAQELEEQGYGCLVNEANGKKTVNYTATLALTVAKLQNLINIQNKKISNLTKELKALKYGRKKNS